MKLKTLKDLYLDELRDVYDAVGLLKMASMIRWYERLGISSVKRL